MKLKLPQHYCIVVSGADKTVVAVKVLHSVHVCITFRVPGTGRYQGLGVSLTYSSRLPVNKSVHTVKQDVSVVVTQVEKKIRIFEDFFFQRALFGLNQLTLKVILQNQKTLFYLLINILNASNTHQRCFYS